MNARRLLLLVLLATTALTWPMTARTAVLNDEPVDGALQVCETCEFTTIGAAIAAANDDDTIAVIGGIHDAPVVIDKPVRLIGIDAPVIDGHGTGTLVRITADDVTLQGFTIRNSGQNFDREDSAVYVEGERVQILDNRMIDTLFGVNAARAHDLLVAGNEIIGLDLDPGIRGDALKVWYSHRTEIAGNTVSRSRDLLVWYSHDVVVRENSVSDGRYGFHFMNSDRGVAERNQLFDNSVGIYLMYGRDFIIRDNLIQGSRGPSGHGIGLKEIDGVEVDGNVILDNRIGVYIDNSPLSLDVVNTFRSNLFAYNDMGLGLLPSTTNNLFSRNSFVDNQQQVAVLGSGSVGSNQWSEHGRGNFWSDYAGYDADGDGVGDVPFKSERLSEQLMNSRPILRLFRFSLAETAVDFGSRAVPLFREEPSFVDEHPLVRPVLPANAPLPAHAPDPDRARLWSLGLLALAAAAVGWGWRGTQFRYRAALPSAAATAPGGLR